MRRGACDYVIKTPNHIRRLPHTIHAQLEKKRAAEVSNRLRQERDRLFDYSLDPLCIAGFDGYFKQLNPAWSNTLGWTTEELLAQPYVELVHPDDRETTTLAISRMVQEHVSLSFESRYRCRDGTYKYLSWNAYPLDEDRLVFAVARDNTARRKAEEENERQLERLAALRQIDLAINAAFDLRVVLNILVEQAARQLRVDQADILLFNQESLMLEYAAGYGFRAGRGPAARMHIGEGYAGRALMQRRVVHVPNLAAAAADPPRGLPPLGDSSVVAYYCVPLIAKGQIMGAMEIFHHAALNSDTEWLDFLQNLAGQAAIAIDNAQLFEGLQRSNADLALAYDATIESWSRALDLRDKETAGHSERVTDMTIKLALAKSIADPDIVHIRRGALLHDIGKMGVPDHILLKPGSLTDEEWVIMRKHPVLAYELLSSIAYLRPALDIPYCHHEKWDGTGYPRGLQGEHIPLAARIFAVVDVWDALRSDRPYRNAWPVEAVYDYIQAQAGLHFDPSVVKTFLDPNVIRLNAG
jgi:PAS domain S-box-containing protein